MAITKAVTLPNGAIAAYWRITESQVLQAPTNAVNVLLGGFVSADASGGGSAPLTQRYFRFQPSDLGMTDLSAVTSASIYAAILAALSLPGSIDPLAGAISS